MSTMMPEAPSDGRGDDARFGHEVIGPTAVGNDLKRFLVLTKTLAVTDFRLRFFGSALGYLWTLMRPLMLFGVLYVVFSIFLDFGDEVRFFPVALLLGIVMFTFLSEATGQAVRSIVMRENLVRKIDFPRLAVPLSTVLTALFNFGLNLIPVLLFFLLSGGTPRWTWLLFPIPVLLLVVLATSLAVLLSALFVRYRDVEPIWDVVLQIVFYASPIFYTLQTVKTRVTDGLGESWGDVIPQALLANPFAALVQQARHWLIDPSHQAPNQTFGNWWEVLLPLGIIAVLAIIATVVFRRAAPQIAEDL